MPCACDNERQRAAAEIQARVQRVTMTDAMRAQFAALQALYEHERRAWLMQWRRAYGIPDDPPLMLHPEHITSSLLL